MLIRRTVLLISTLLFACTIAAAETQPTDSDADKEKKQKELDERVVKMLDQSVGDATTLRLACNRAIFYAITADLYWKYDEKRARELFKNATTELLVINQETEKEHRESTDPLIELYNVPWGDPRGDILPLVAKHDAELALNMLLATRSARLSEAMARVAAGKAKPADMMSWNPDVDRAAGETALEQRFALLAADENPEKAIKLIKDSLSKGVSANVLALLQKLFKKDEKKAGELAGDVIKKLIDSDLVKNYDDMSTAVSFLQYAFKPEQKAGSASAKVKDEKMFTFSDDQARELARKIADALLEPSKSMAMAMTLNRTMPMLEKYVPEKLVLLKMRETENQSTMPPEVKKMQERQKMWDPNSTAEDLLAQIARSENEYEKATGYSMLEKKISDIEDDTRAKKLIDQITDEKSRANVLEQYQNASVTRTANAGKLDDARKMIGGLAKKSTRIQRLVALATDFQKKGGEKDIANARSLMREARVLTNDAAESEDDLGDLMEVVKGYAAVDPDIAFKMFEPVIDQINDYMGASAITAKYQVRQNSTFKNGEIIMMVKIKEWTPLFRFIKHMQLLAKADLERMNTLADRFNRPDSRAIVKLFVLQGYLKDDKKPEEPEPQNNYD